MNPRLILFITAVCFGVQGKAIDTDQTGEDEAGEYYWKDYHGYIPRDAFKAGKDSHGKSVYIGQVLHNGILIPGKIAEGDKELAFEWGHSEYKTGKNVKILCTPHPEQYDWIKTDTKEIKSLDKKFVTGGYEPGNGDITYIGKIVTDGADDIGKLLVNENEFGGLHTTKDGKGIQHAEFEALYYNPQVKVTNRSSDDGVTEDTEPNTHHIPSEATTCGPRVININID